MGYTHGCELGEGWWGGAIVAAEVIVASKALRNMSACVLTQSTIMTHSLVWIVQDCLLKLLCGKPSRMHWRTVPRVYVEMSVLLYCAYQRVRAAFVAPTLLAGLRDIPAG